MAAIECVLGWVDRRDSEGSRSGAHSNTEDRVSASDPFPWVKLGPGSKLSLDDHILGDPLIVESNARGAFLEGSPRLVPVHGVAVTPFANGEHFEEVVSSSHLFT